MGAGRRVLVTNGARRGSLSPQWGEGRGALPLKQHDVVMFLNVQSIYILLSHWGCETLLVSKTVHCISSNNCASDSSPRTSARAIAVVPPTSPASAC